MRLRVGAGAIRGAMLAAVGALPAIACSGSEMNDEPATNGGSSNGGGATASGGGGATSGTSPGGSGGRTVPGGTTAGGAGGQVPGGASPGGGGGGRPSGGTGGSAGPYVCDDPQPAQNQPGLLQCSDGVLQRNPATRCAPPAIVAAEGPAIPPQMPNVTCRTHAECTEKPYGTCVLIGVGTSSPQGTRCNYGCSSDADCQEGSTCVCADGAMGTCFQGCSSNASCPDAEPCAFIRYTQECETLTKVQCGVDCRTDADCPTGSGARCENGGCRFNVACGRPFLVEGTARVAPPAIRGDWAELAVPSTDSLSAGVRAALACHWTELGLMEHASVAAFARFTLQLLALGAPASLVESATAALADEAAHARLCFGFAGAYAGHDVGPGPLALERALADESFSRTLRTAFLEACVGETTAALEAAECAAHATDPAVAAALRRIAADETRHAELGWRFVTWALETASAEVRRMVLHELDALAAGRVTQPATTDALLEHGVPSSALRAAVRAAALRDVVQPCLAALRSRFDSAQMRPVPGVTAFRALQSRGFER